MEMEHHHHQEPQFSINDLRQLVSGQSSSTHFNSIPPPPPPPPLTAELFPGHPNHQHYEMMVFGHRHVAEILPRCLHDFAATTDAAAAAATTPTTTTNNSASTPPLSGLEAETAAAACIGGGEGSTTGRWPRQETLTLLDIRSRLDPKFKEANQKGPLWDEVSRIMSEEHGYQRSGKKCREKFENLYKYYKKTKEGKAGRQDGKHYRFFRQLEALYGENNSIQTTSVPETNFGSSSLHHAPSQTFQEMYQSPHHKHNCDSISLTNSTDFDTSSSDYNNDHSTEGLNNNESMEKRRKRMMSGRSWKVKIKEFIDLQMKKLVEKQEEWMDKLLKTMEQKEKERVLREEEWKRQEVERLEREHKFWAKERAWIEARDAALTEALQKLTGSDEMKSQLSLEGVNVMAVGVQNHNENQNNEDGGSEILNTTIIRNNYSRSNGKEGNKKRKENSRSCFYFDNNDHQSSLFTQGSGGAYCDINDQRHESARRMQTNDGSSTSNSNVGNIVGADSCFPFFMSEGSGNLWENYSLRVNKANQSHNHS
ncbi:hypothetical protein RIF29_39789 [Crotalaria pallida]|uniref:Myb-like domain-containing protein n=1 Tax=Crotalaria pallida TaxID=3830 RepID=A0AAN9E7B2_CROPI